VIKQREDCLKYVYNNKTEFSHPHSSAPCLSSAPHVFSSALVRTVAQVEKHCRNVISPFAVKLFLLPFSSRCSTQISFSGPVYLIKPPQPSSAVYGALPFTGHPSKCCCLL